MKKNKFWYKNNHRPELDVIVYHVFCFITFVFLIYFTECAVCVLKQSVKKYISNFQSLVDKYAV